MQPQERTVSVSGSRVTYVAFGRGEQPLVLVPGLSLRSIHGSALPLAWMYRLFAKDYRVYVIDKKEDLPEDCTIRGLAGDLAQTMTQLGVAGADVVGISQGGMIAQELAIRHPELVRKLVLGVTLSRTNDTVKTVVESWIQMAERGDDQAIVEDMLLKMYSDAYVQKYRRLFPILLKMTKLTEPERFIRLAKACLTCETYDALDQIRCPVLVLGGREDRIVTARASEEITERLGCAIHLYDGLGHSAYEEAPDFNRRILEFLNA